ncbi:MAG: isoprenylcysteine carboxylmethyltransferase family protein [Lachnospiraceae bacterium]|nr:isoprenylcysteine carboxylmethyltransferase family protein [Lachnospiraceae bacterium]
MNKKEHLPLLGVGPVIVAGQIIITVIGIVIFLNGHLELRRIEELNIPLKILGILLIVFGLYLNYSAKRKSKLFDMVTENKLITTGVYSIVRNPVYSAVLLMCTGAVCVVNNIILFVIPIICWIYMTVFLMVTEEKWLIKLYGQEYLEYCKKVNRCIPWFPRCK